MDQSPAPGATVDLGSLVTISVSNGHLPQTNVPDVKGLIKSDAIGRLHAAGFVVQIVYVEVKQADKIGKVLDQNPEPGLKADAGSTVTIDVGHKATGTVAILRRRE